MFTAPDSLKVKGSLSEIFKGLRQFVGAIPQDAPLMLREMKNCAVYNVLNLSSILMDQVDFYLKKIDVYPLKYYVNGGHSMLFESSSGLLVKLNSSEPMVSDPAISDMVLQPLISHQFSARVYQTNMEVLPALNTQEVTMDHVNALGIALAKKGYVFWDNEIHNVGLLPDGTPIVIDPGAVISVASCPDREYLQKYEFWKVMDAPEYGWEGKQEKYFGELRKSFEGRVDPEDLKRRRARPYEFQEYPPHWGM